MAILNKDKTILTIAYLLIGSLVTVQAQQTGHYNYGTETPEPETSSAEIFTSVPMSEIGPTEETITVLSTVSLPPVTLTATMTKTVTLSECTTSTTTQSATTTVTSTLLSTIRVTLPTVLSTSEPSVTSISLPLSAFTFSPEPFLNTTCTDSVTGSMTTFETLAASSETPCATTTDTDTLVVSATLDVPEAATSAFGITAGPPGTGAPRTTFGVGGMTYTTSGYPVTVSGSSSLRDKADAWTPLLGTLALGFWILVTAF